MDKVQVSVCSHAAFGVHTVDGFMPLCVMPWPRRKRGLCKQCRLPSRLFRLGALQLSQCVECVCMSESVCVCVCAYVHISGLSPPHCLERTSQGDPRLPKTKFPRFLAAGLCVWSHTISCRPCDLDSPWHDDILNPPPREMFHPAVRRASPLAHWFNFNRGGSAVLALDFWISPQPISSEVIWSKSAHFPHSRWFVFPGWLLCTIV